MNRALSTAVTGMAAQQLKVDVTANNLANINTTGFKKSSVEFQDLLYQTLREAGTKTEAGNEIPNPLQVGHGTQPVSTSLRFQQGTLQDTGNVLDVAISGEGFFQIKRPDGTTGYTRDGSFKIDADGTLVTSQGLPVYPEVSIPDDAQSVSISTEGIVSVVMIGSDNPEEIGTLEIARFPNNGGLKAIGNNLYMKTGATGEPIVAEPGKDGLGVLRQGYLEGSNVQVMEEMVDLITAQRAFEANSKTISTAEELLRMANGMKR